MNNSMENSNVTHKEEILAKSRKTGKDEGMEYAQLRGNKLGEYTMCAAAIIIMTFTVLFGELVATLAVAATLLGFTAGQCFMKYHFTRKKSYLIWTAGIAMAAVFLFVFLVARSLEWRLCCA